MLTENKIAKTNNTVPSGATNIDQKYSIQISGMYKKLSRHFSISNLSLKVTKGSMHAIVGTSGSGKTITIKTIVGGIIPDAGKIFINGIDARKPNAKQFIGYVPEFVRFPKNIKAYDYLKVLAKISGMPSKMINDRLKELMVKFDLWKFRNKDVNSFSSGMKRKVMFIQGVIHNPDIVILDEPGSNLDTMTRKFIFKYMKDLTKQGKTIFFSEHLLDEVKEMIDECSIIYRGKLLYNGPIDGLNIKNIFILNTNENRKLVIFMKKNKIKCSINNNGVIYIKLNNMLELNKIFNFVTENQIIIHRIEPYRVDLDIFYSALVNKQK